jgi:hypothetical protein
MQPNPIDLERLLKAFQEMFAHMLTLQDLIGTDDNRTYEEVKPKYDQQAEREFALFYQALNDPAAFARAVREFERMHPKSGPIH